MTPRLLWRSAGWVLALGLALAGTVVYAGVPITTLDPPGPPASTRPLAEPRIPIDHVPYDINAGGSYYLTGNMTPAIDPNNTAAIRIFATDVTLDLAGFTLSGTSGDPATGILVGNAPRNITIRNGTVQDFTTGIDASVAFSSRVDGVTVRGHGLSYGIRIGASAVVENCVVNGGGVGGNGVELGVRGVVRGCVITGNVGYGIRIGTYGLIEHNQIVNNGTLGPAYGGVLADDNDVVVRDNYLSNSNGLDVRTTQNKRATVIDNELTGCGSVAPIVPSGAFVFAPLDGPEHSNVTHNTGYCP